MKKTFSALPTPFLDGKIDFQSLEKLIDFQVKNNIEGLVFSGSTGEGHNLSRVEWEELISFGIKIVKVKNKQYNKEAVVVAGCGFNSTTLAVDYAKKANELNIDYILATVPHYNKPQQDGIYQHFAEICKAVDTNIILYNVPSRTATDMKNETIIRLVKDFKNIVALKDATGVLTRVSDIKYRLNEIGRDDFLLLSGEDETQIGFNAMGGKGVISVVSNVFPSLCVEIQKLCEKNDFVGALSMQNQLTELSRAMFFETNPVPVKYALKAIGIFKTDDVRLPLMPASKECKENIDNLIKKYKVQL